jgi:hypothetical protein
MTKTIGEALASFQATAENQPSPKPSPNKSVSLTNPTPPAGHSDTTVLATVHEFTDADRKRLVQRAERHRHHMQQRDDAQRILRANRGRIGVAFDPATEMRIVL